MIGPDALWRDYTGRFEQRPYFKETSLEVGAVTFLREALGGEPTWPLSDDDLEFVADMAASFDRGRDVASLGLDVDAVTVFAPSGRPRIVMNESLRAANMRLRRRMTIAHELGHVALHQPMYRRDERQLELLHDYRAIPAYCHDTMSSASVDWCEWQANYFGGALLAPKAQILSLLQQRFHGVSAARDQTPEAVRAIDLVAGTFDISKPAARVRLAQVAFIAPASDEQLPSQTA